MSRPACGTRNGYQAHIRRGEKTCEPCRAANAASQRESRGRDQWWRATKRAREQALIRLSHEHPDEYRNLYAEELGQARKEAS